MLKDILFILKESIGAGKAIAKEIKNAKDKSDKEKIKRAILDDDRDYINRIIRGG